MQKKKKKKYWKFFFFFWLIHLYYEKGMELETLHSQFAQDFYPCKNKPISQDFLKSNQ